MDQIRSDVVRMGTEAGDMVRAAVEATINGDADRARQIIEQDSVVDEYERRVVQAAVVAVMKESPVADDLRFLISTLGIVGEIEKVGDHAVKLSRRALKLVGEYPSEMRVPLVELGELVRRSFAGSLRLYNDFTPERANEVIEGDTAVDLAYASARKRIYLMIQARPDSAEHLVRTMECFHALEHVADNAVAIAVRMSMLYGR